MDRKSVKVRSYANIAIIKYWGKKDTVKIIPATSSISLTLENMYTETTLSSLPASAQSDEFISMVFCKIKLNIKKCAIL